jgi:2-(1,2-epoxy-1,2-dihydrophenyl)acetyl-CoA isomerase
MTDEERPVIDLHIGGGIAEIVLNAPQRLNALDAAGLVELRGAYDRAEEAGVRALLLRGEGRAFCAGRDISAVDPRHDDVTGFLAGILTPLLRRMSDFPAPTFAVAHGACLGVGLGLLIATDVVYVADTAKIGSPFAGLGAALDSGGHALFFERLGAHKTLDLIYTGRLMSGTEAVESGLFSRVFPADQVTDAALDAARAAAAGATSAFLASKDLIRRLRDERLGLWEAMDAENAAQAALRDTADYREGFAAFQQKRAPRFTGR